MPEQQLNEQLTQEQQRRDHELHKTLLAIGKMIRLSVRQAIAIWAGILAAILMTIVVALHIIALNTVSRQLEMYRCKCNHTITNSNDSNVNIALPGTRESVINDRLKDKDRAKLKQQEEDDSNNGRTL